VLSVSFCTSHFLALWWGDALQRWLKLFPGRLLMISKCLCVHNYQIGIAIPRCAYPHPAVPLLPQPQYVQNWINYILPGSRFSLLAFYLFLMTLGYTWLWGSKVLTSLTSALFYRISWSLLSFNFSPSCLGSGGFSCASYFPSSIPRKSSLDGDQHTPFKHRAYHAI